MSCRMIKPTKWPVRPVKTQVRLGIRRSESSLSAHWVAKVMRTVKTDQTRQMPSLIWVFAWHTDHFVGFVMLWLFLIFWNSLPLRKKKKYLPTDRPFSRVRGNKDIFKGGPDIAMLHQSSKLYVVSAFFFLRDLYIVNFISQSKCSGSTSSKCCV